MLMACTQNPYAHLTDAEVHEKAQKMPLSERYAFYVAISESRIPSKPIVAEDLVLLGEPARKYVFSQALSGSRREFTHALTALSAFKGECTPYELNLLRSRVGQVATSQEQAQSLVAHVLIACEVSVPSNLRKAW